MTKLIILAALVALAGCTTTERRDFCREKLAIAVSEKPAGAVETADNDYDTDATVANIRAHSEVVERICGAVPAPRR